MGSVQDCGRHREAPQDFAHNLLDVVDLRVEATSQGIRTGAVDGLSFSLRRGETLGLVGESGCGKSMTCLAIVGLNPAPASKVVGGVIRLRGEDLLTGTGESRAAAYRGRDISMILQDPLTSLNPMFSIGFQLCEPMRVHLGMSKRTAVARAAELLDLLRIPRPKEQLRKYPHQLSGGMRQRVAGAIALACGPDLLIADEPTTSLDVTVQAAYLKLLREIQLETELAILFVTHDLGVIAQMADRVAVMLNGRLVEDGPREEVLEHPKDPYTQQLVSGWRWLYG